ncbi:hypothetical protein FZEAL_8850 [Fusarium zealandicum]|uniref:Uncharacterized protein n=1 Tax=Fusarium zealandicum TaxID=1053134 RepID=A0A8H4UD23_9HYPO|nr:hypothetical protein FZEAL_8850 [Fusarium zealandicum]
MSTRRSARLQKQLNPEPIHVQQPAPPEPAKNNKRKAPATKAQNGKKRATASTSSKGKITSAQTQSTSPNAALMSLPTEILELIVDSASGTAQSLPRNSADTMSIDQTLSKP